MTHEMKGTYIKIGVILALITAVEVAYPYITQGNQTLAPLYMPILGVMSLAKFLLVVGFFMHLKFDHQIFKRVFAFSLLITLLFFVAFLYLFQVA